jgi:hypothetical protein
MKKRFETFMVSFFVLALCFGVILGISILKQQYSNGGIGGRVLGVVGAMVVVAVNWVLMGVMMKLAEYEGHYSITHFNVSIARSLSIVIKKDILLLFAH